MNFKRSLFIIFNKSNPKFIFCPLTTKIKNYHGNLILNPTSKNGLKDLSEVLTFHIRSLSKSRLKSKMGKIDSSELKQVHACLGDIMRY